MICTLPSKHTRRIGYRGSACFCSIPTSIFALKVEAWAWSRVPTATDSRRSGTKGFRQTWPNLRQDRRSGMYEVLHTECAGGWVRRLTMYGSPNHTQFVRASYFRSPISQAAGGLRRPVGNGACRCMIIVGPFTGGSKNDRDRSNSQEIIHNRWRTGWGGNVAMAAPRALSAYQA